MKPWTYRIRTVVGGEPLDVVFEVDWQKLAQIMARKAHDSKAKRTAFAAGALRLKIK